MIDVLLTTIIQKHKEQIMKIFIKSLIRKDGNPNVAKLKTTEIKNDIRYINFLRDTNHLNGTLKQKMYWLLSDKPHLKCEYCSTQHFNLTKRFCSKQCSALYTSSDRMKKRTENYLVVEKETVVVDISDEDFYALIDAAPTRSLKNYLIKHNIYRNVMEYKIDNDDNLKEIIFRLQKRLKNRLICLECNTPIVNNSFKNQVCSKKCSIVSKRRIEKVKNTKLKQYGDENYNNPDKMINSKLNNIDNKGLNSFDRQLMKMKKTKKERYDNEHYNNSKLSHQNKIKNIDLNGLNSYDRAVIKRQKTCLRKYGVSSFSQSPIFTPNYQFKDYKLPSGKIIKIQGYENKLLDDLLKVYDENEIITSRTYMPEFWYIGEDNKKHRYFPDMYIPSTNTIYEVKSTYTIKCQVLKNRQKFKSVLREGYNLIIKVY